MSELRRVYGEQLVVLGVWADRDTRVSNLARRLGRSASDMKSEGHRADAEDLIGRDERELGHDLGQNVRDAYPEADYFVDGSSRDSIEAGVARLLRLVFGQPFTTPSREEAGMFHASAAAYRSAALGRQVGAAIVADDGDLLVVGMNEVPRAGGGHYWEGDEGDAREFRRGEDTNDAHKRGIATQVVESLHAAGWLKGDGSSAELVAAALEKGGPLSQTSLMNLTEFNRDVHAEMSAILTAARRGTAIRGARLLCTTFPCHNCAKHIVGAGIREVVYIEPYAKSFASESHDDAIALERRSDPSARVAFVPFTGVAPRRFAAWFAMRRRKASAGKTITWVAHEARPGSGRLDSGYITREREFVDSIFESLHEAEILLV